jgi:hypothetical protein
LLHETRRNPGVDGVDRVSPITRMRTWPRGSSAGSRSSENPLQAEVHVHDEVGAVGVEKTSPFCVVADQCSSVPDHAR